MVVNRKNSGADRVKFISYDGRYPNLCHGVLTLEIDGEIVKFGHDYMLPHTWDENGKMILGDADNYHTFWYSGGRCGFTDNHYSNTYVNKGEWQIDVDDLPEKYWDLADELDKIINENVPYGCCGGCL